MKLCEFSITRPPAIGAALQTPTERFRHDVLNTVAKARMRQECPIAFFRRRSSVGGHDVVLFLVEGGQFDGQELTAGTCRRHGIVVKGSKGVKP